MRIKQNNAHKLFSTVLGNSMYSINANFNYDANYKYDFNYFITVTASKTHLLMFRKALR